MTKEEDASESSTEHVTSDTSDAEARNVGRKRSIDESNLEPDERKKLESRRAYNRQCAAKARKRSKELVSQLQQQVEDLTQEKGELKRSNEVMRAQLDLLEQQNRALMMNQLGGAAANPLLTQQNLLMQRGGAVQQALQPAANPAATNSSLLERLLAERIAAQNRLELGNNNNNNNSNGSKDAAPDQKFMG